jgi:flagellar protein FliO/FliZ
LSLPLRLHAAVITAILGCLLGPAAALAQRGEQTRLDLPADEPRQVEAVSGGGLVRTVVGLAVVLAVIYGLHWVLKQVKASKEARAVGSGLESAASVPLGPNRSLHLVRAGTELVLVGVAEQGVTPIRTYTEEEARAVGLLVDPVDHAEDDASGAPAGPHRAMTIGAAIEAVRRRTVRS